MRKDRKLTKATKVFQNLHADILSGHFAEGTKLQMENLKEKYNIGYSPLREALSRLVTQGLVEMEEQCGFKVAAMSLTDFYDLSMLRKHIDSLAIDLSILHGDHIWESEVIAKWHQFSKYTDPKTNDKIDMNVWRQLQKEFLTTLIKGCGSPWLLKISTMLYDQASRYRTLCLLDIFHKKEWRIEYLKEKEQLMQAMLARDKEKALKIAHRNWKRNMKVTADILKNKELQKINNRR